MLSNNIVTSQSKVVQEYKYQEDKNVKSIEENLDGKVKDSNILSATEQKKKTKPRWPITSSDINYKKDKGGNYHMTLIYNSDSNDVRFSKDDDPVIIIKNDNVKNEGDYWRFVAKIRECCEQKISKGKKYYFEDYLDDHGFIEKEIDINEIRREIELLRKKRYSGIQK